MNHTDQSWPSCSGRKPPAPIQLVCFPYAGGSASAYRLWGQELSGDVDVFPIQPPGREDRSLESFARTLTELIGDAADIISASVNDKPFCFFGHSFGGLIAFETIRELRRRKCPLPVGLFASGRSAPALGAVYPLNHLTDSELLVELLRLDPENQATLRQPEVFQALLPQLRADLKICDGYVYKSESPLSIPIIGFAGDSDPVGTPERVQAWCHETTAHFRFHLLNGHHFFLRSVRQAFMNILRAELHDLPIDLGVTTPKPPSNIFDS